MMASLNVFTSLFLQGVASYCIVQASIVTATELQVLEIHSCNHEDTMPTWILGNQAGKAVAIFEDDVMVGHVPFNLASSSKGVVWR